MNALQFHICTLGSCTLPDLVALTTNPWLLEVLHGRTPTVCSCVILLPVPSQVDASSAGLEVFKTASAFKLRWFTPSIEVPLCGHATLASAAVIFAGECMLQAQVPLN